jgi:pullulanase/glycogen debranching enzyme
MVNHIEDLQKLLRCIKSLIALRKRQASLSGRSYADMTQKAIQKNGADLTWTAMDIDKLTHEAHAAAVDCGFADPRSAEAYGPIYFYPSSLHKYKYTPPKPRCRQ